MFQLLYQFLDDKAVANFCDNFTLQTVGQLTSGSRDMRKYEFKQLFASRPIGNNCSVNRQC